MHQPSFKRVTIGVAENPDSPSPMNTFLTVADLNADGRPDVVLSGRDGHMFWFENRGAEGWQRHTVAPVAALECGGTAFDLTGNGTLDIIDGGDWRSDELAWWQHPAEGDGPWERHLILKTGATQYHDEIIGDVTGDGNLSLIAWNQGSGTIYRLPLDQDHFASPWREVEVIASGMYMPNQEGRQLPEEGLAIADLDGDGQNEIIAGTRWYKHTPQGWQAHQYADGYITTVIAVGDLDGDGQLEIVISEGDACIYGHPQGGRVAWFKPGPDPTALWQEHRLAEGIFDPHSLAVGDLCGNGQRDILVGEIGVAERLTESPPRLMIYANDGTANFIRHIIDTGTGTHHAKLVDLRGTGRLDIVSRPLHGPEKWTLFAWLNESGVTEEVGE